MSMKLTSAEKEKLREEYQADVPIVIVGRLKAYETDKTIGRYRNINN